MRLLLGKQGYDEPRAAVKDFLLAIADVSLSNLSTPPKCCSAYSCCNTPEDTSEWCAAHRSLLKLDAGESHVCPELLPALTAFLRSEESRCVTATDICEHWRLAVGKRLPMDATGTDDAAAICAEYWKRLGVGMRLGVGTQ